MTKFTIELPASIFIRTHAGKALNVVPAEVEKVLGKVAEIGMKTILTNVWNGGGKDATDAERLAAFLKKLDSWKRGEFNVVERGESQYTAFREVFVADCIAAGMTTKGAEDAIKAKVSERLGKDAKATFANFIESTAIEYMEASKGSDDVMTRDEARERLEAYYAHESDRRAKEREAAGKKIKLPVIDLASFRKPAVAE